MRFPVCFSFWQIQFAYIVYIAELFCLNTNCLCWEGWVGTNFVKLKMTVNQASSHIFTECKHQVKANKDSLNHYCNFETWRCRSTFGQQLPSWHSNRPRFHLKVHYSSKTKLSQSVK